MAHIPVLLKEVLELLDPKAGETFVDATLGDGGHAIEIIARLGISGKFLGIDLDQTAIETAKRKLQSEKLKIKEVIFEIDSFGNIKNLVQKHKLGRINGILFDLGLRSEHLDESGRGFSFLRDEPLDMRFGSSHLASGETEHVQYQTAAEIVNSASENELTHIFRKFGEERFSNDIARAVLRARRKESFSTTKQLVEVVLSVYREKLHSKKEIPWIGGIHPATRVFQALRIAVNNELEVLEKVLPDAVDLLVPGGRIAIISFHSLEDRIVKHFLRSRKDLKILTKKPIISSEEEIKNNPRSRSAKLRVASKL